MLLTAGNVCAQTFSPDMLSLPQKTSSTENRAEAKPNTNEEEPVVDETINELNQALSKQETSSDANDPLTQISKALSAKEQEENIEDKIDEEDNDTEEKEEDIFIPEGELYRLDTPTLDGSLRGGQAFVEVDDRGRMKKTTKIFLFYDEFRILNPDAKLPTCNVRFNILSTLDKKISQLDVKLVWPGLTTTLSFSDVLPNTQTYYNYALLSAGCYNMDKAPNIIVNRCRVKGMTAMECANKLLWLSK